MQKYMVWFGGILLICIAIYRLTNALTPKVGPVGNGPNEQLIWSEFVIMMIGGIMFLALGFVILVLERTRRPTKTIQLVSGIGGFGVLILYNGFVVIGSPSIFLSVINLMVMVVLSAFLGAFIRELIFQWKKEVK